MTVSNALPNLPSLPWRRFENFCNDMLPVQLNHPVRGLPLTSDRMKTYPKFLKGKVEVRIFKQGKQSLSLACLGAGPVTYRLMSSYIHIYTRTLFVNLGRNWQLKKLVWT